MWPPQVLPARKQSGSVYPQERVTITYDRLFTAQIKIFTIALAGISPSPLPHRAVGSVSDLAKVALQIGPDQLCSRS